MSTGNVADATEEAAPGAATELTAQNVAASGKIEVGCRAPRDDRGGTAIENGRIVALKVSSLTSQNGA
jgi:hypothetical protein